MAKLTEKSWAVLNYIRENEKADGLTMNEIADGIGLTVKQIGPIVWTSLKAKKDGSRGDLVRYEKREVPGADKPVGFVFLTDEGREYSDPVEEIAE